MQKYGNVQGMPNTRKYDSIHVLRRQRGDFIVSGSIEGNEDIKECCKRESKYGGDGSLSKEPA